MSYDTVEDGLLTVLRKVAGITARNSSKGDFRVLARGVPHAVILTPGAFTREVVAAPRRLRQAWTVNVLLFIPFQTELSEIASKIRTFRQAVLDEVDKYPTLDSASGVINAFITGGDEPTDWIGESRRWWQQTLRAQIEERSTVTIAE